MIYMSVLSFRSRLQICVWSRFCAHAHSDTLSLCASYLLSLSRSQTRLLARSLARFVYLSSTSLSVCLSVCLSVFLSVCLSVCLSVYLSVCVSSFALSLYCDLLLALFLALACLLSGSFTHARTHGRANARIYARMYARTYARTHACMHTNAQPPVVSKGEHGEEGEASNAPPQAIDGSARPCAQTARWWWGRRAEDQRGWSGRWSPHCGFQRGRMYGRPRVHMGQSLPARPARGIFVVAFLWSWVHLLLLRLRRAEVPRHSTALCKTQRTLTTQRRDPVRMQAASDGKRSFNYSSLDNKKSPRIKRTRRIRPRMSERNNRIMAKKRVVKCKYYY